MLATWLNHPIHFEISNRGLSLLSPVRVGAGNCLSVEQRGMVKINYRLSTQ